MSERIIKPLTSALLAMFLVGACSADESSEQITSIHPSVASQDAVNVQRNPLNNAYFGDTHVHTGLSFDAYIMGTRRTPHDAYVYAKGGVIEHASGQKMRLHRPLDFLAVSDHGFYLGMMRAIADEAGPHADHYLSNTIREVDGVRGSTAAFQAFFQHLISRQEGEVDDLDDPRTTRSAWQEVIDAAEQHNEPGRFTTFIAYEYTSAGPRFETLHRNVIFSGSRVPEKPFTRLDSINPEHLWAWMDDHRRRGIDSLAIPHNSNSSLGWMFEDTYFMSDQPIDESYADLRARNEPLVENTQVKGTSDTHPLLSPNDEWADFEIVPLLAGGIDRSAGKGSYIRETYLRGLLLENDRGVNPYKFGLVGSSDTHNAGASVNESEHWGNTGLLDVSPRSRGSVANPDSQLTPGAPSPLWSASGLAGVWAASNSREDIFEAMRRKETFSTTGPRIKVRFFAGYEFGDIAGTQDAVKKAYAGGVPMGSTISAQQSASPMFFVHAYQDPDSLPLQRIQIIKGWVDDGEGHERVFDVACSDGASPDPNTHRCPDNGARVDLTDCSTTAGVGNAELSSTWVDPSFNADHGAFYYVRVLENPGCRWSTYDAIRAGVDPISGVRPTIQDRAWSSPIWISPTPSTKEGRGQRSNI